MALKLIIDNWRWAGVPFYLRTGKALGVKRTEVAIKFKQAPFAMFNCTPVEELAQNYLVIGVAAERRHRAAVQHQGARPLDLDRRRRDEVPLQGLFQGRAFTGYETLIYDCMIGDNILFQRADSVEAGWKAVQPFLDAWKKAGADGLKIYKAGSEGPEEANDLLNATAEAGESSDNDGRERQPPRHRGCRSGGAGDDAAERVLARTAANSGRVAICLTGGSSPKQLYQLLATEAYRSRIPWHRVHWFIGDERFVPADDPLNNMGMARAIFLDRCAPAANIHPIPTATADPADPDRAPRFTNTN